MEREKFKIDIRTPDPGYEPFPVAIMNRFTSEVTTFNPVAGESARIHYRLSKAGCIRIRIVRRDNKDLLYRTLLDWTDQEFGEYDVEWDGRDSSGNIVDNKNAFVLFEAKDQGRGLQHCDHNRAECCDPLLWISTNTDMSKSVNGNIEIQTAFKKNNKFVGTKKNLEVRYYLNDRTINRESYDSGSNQFSYSIDTTTLGNGDYLLTVNVDDSHDHIGSASVKFTVEK